MRKYPTQIETKIHCLKSNIMRKIKITLYNLMINIIKCFLKLGVFITLPAVFIYFLFNPKTKN